MFIFPSMPLTLFVGLVGAVRSSFKEQPHVIELDTVVNAKRWMQDVTPVLHDHLKAHQFKFERNGNGECRLFYKEWSCDAYWLPDTGLSLLPLGNIDKVITVLWLLYSISQRVQFHLNNHCSLSQYLMVRLSKSLLQQ